MVTEWWEADGNVNSSDTITQNFVKVFFLYVSAILYNSNFLINVVLSKSNYIMSKYGSCTTMCAYFFAYVYWEKAVSTRVAAGIWWFFTLIMVACYTANLAAFLTTENPNEEFTNVEELAQQTEIKYGAKVDGATFLFFNESKEKLHNQMFNYMMVNKKDVLVDQTPEGVSRAASEKYAFLMESSQIEYEIERQCSLTQIGKQLDDKGYGIAMKKGSCYLGTFSQNVLKMQEDGRLTDLKRKWWKEKYAGTCAKEEPNDAEKLGLSNVGGVFLVLGLGVGVAFFVAILEQFIYVWNLSREEQISIKEHLRRELAFFLQCHGTTKPVSFENGSDKSDEALTYD